MNPDLFYVIINPPSETELKVAKKGITVLTDGGGFEFYPSGERTESGGFVGTCVMEGQSMQYESILHLGDEEMDAGPLLVIM